MGTWSSRSDVPPPSGLKPLSEYKLANDFGAFINDDAHANDLRKRFEAYIGPIKAPHDPLKEQRDGLRPAVRYSTDVRFGSKADIRVHPRDVRFTPKSGHWNLVAECLLCAKSGHSLTRS